MKTWQQALKILLKEIDLPVVKLAEMTDTSASSIHKYIQGKNNSTSATVQSWIEACERYRTGSRRMFHLICIGEEIYRRDNLTVQEHVKSMSCLELSNYLKAIANHLGEGIENAEDNPQQKPDYLPQTPGTESPQS
jgi:predicted transcriptional regulator